MRSWGCELLRMERVACFAFRLELDVLRMPWTLPGKKELACLGETGLALGVCREVELRY